MFSKISKVALQAIAFKICYGLIDVCKTTALVVSTMLHVGSIFDPLSRFFGDKSSPKQAFCFKTNLL